MAVEKINIEEFLKLSENLPVIDVRSPAEFIQAHIPSVYSLPLFSDEERKIVGTTYKQKSREAAIKTGLEFFGVKMKNMVEEAEQIIGNRQQAISKNQLLIANCIVVYCWRGGMRSAAVAWLFDLYGYKVYVLRGGYKAYRNWVLQQFTKKYNLKILGGYTGSGKTILLKQLQALGLPVIDLEKLAKHKGSAFGALGEEAQPRQEMFENMLASELIKNSASEIWVEDESQRIGNMNIPNALWEQMRTSPVYFLDIPFEERLGFITGNYGQFEKEKLTEAILRIQKKLGGADTKEAINYLLENNITECFRILLKYYDKLYLKGLHSRKNYDELLNIIPCKSVTDDNVNKFLLQQA